jgi:hypothetical protein
MRGAYVQQQEDKFMAEVAKVHQDKLERIKKNITESYVYFQRNREYFNNMRNFVLNTTITDAQRSALEELDRTVIEFNVLEAFISRLLGEFSKQVPGINVYSDPTVSIPPESTINFVQSHMRHIITNLRANEIYKDQLTGGFSCMKVWTEYEHFKSFKQKICLDRVFDPLLVFFDPAAQKVHKGDGSYCGEIIPLTEEQFRASYGDEIKLEGCYAGSLGGFKWGYKSGRKKIIMLCYYYEKKSRKVQIYELPNGISLTKKEYEDMLLIYEEKKEISQPPIPINKRWTDVPYICRYEIIANQVLSYVETDLCGLPLIFVDGNSATLRRNGDASIIEQVTRSYIHNAVGAQKLKNLAGQTIANHIETLIEHKMKVALDSVPPEYMDAYTNVQSASNYMYNQYSEDGTKQYNPPEEVIKVPLPPEITTTFMGAEQTIQSSLGSYDAALGINKNQLSGVAIVEGATQSNAAAMPFVVNYLAALQQAAEIILDLIPKYYVTPRTLPIINSKDQNEHVTINGSDPSSPKMNFDSSDLKVEVKAGVNFEVQKNRALQMLIQLSEALPGMAQLINNPKGLAIVADNLSFKGADQIKQLAEEEEKQQQQNKNMPPPPSPIQQKLAMEQQKNISKDQNEKIALSIRKQEANTKTLGTMADIANAGRQASIQQNRNNTELAVHHINARLKNKEIDNNFATDLLNSASNMMSNASPDQGNIPPQSQIVPENNQ